MRNQKMTKTSKWKEIPGHLDYQAHPDGKVRSRKKGYWRELKPYSAGQGYRALTLRTGGENCRVALHRLIWMTFRSEIPKGLEINHKNGRKTDNRLGNLELVTRSENCKHMYRVLGHPPRGGQKPGGKLKRYKCECGVDIGGIANFNRHQRACGKTQS